MTLLPRPRAKSLARRRTADGVLLTKEEAEFLHAMIGGIDGEQYEKTRSHYVEGTLPPWHGGGLGRLMHLFAKLGKR